MYRKELRYSETLLHIYKLDQQNAQVLIFLFTKLQWARITQSV